MIGRREGRAGPAVPTWLLGLVVAVAVVGYVVVVDLGVHAGLMHTGVSVEGVDVGRLTYVETVDLLQDRAAKLRDEPLVFSTPGFTRRLVPRDLGWRPRVTATTTRAFAVGRDGAFLQAGLDRVRALTRGIEVQWQDVLRRRRLQTLIERWMEDAASVGIEIDGHRLESRIREAITTWPRRQVSFPLA